MLEAPFAIGGEAVAAGRRSAESRRSGEAFAVAEIDESREPDSGSLAVEADGVIETGASDPG